jgi:homoserine O-acetyltransferase
MVGPGRPVDTDRYRVLGMDWLGKHPLRFLAHAQAAATRGTDPKSDRRFPLISTQDQARALHHVLEELGTGSVHTFVGSSYGGMVGLAFAAEYPRCLNRLVVISGAHRTHPMATAHRVVQRRIVELGRGTGCVSDGLALARALAMTTYRSVDEFDVRFSTRPGDHDGTPRFDVEEYLLAQGAKFCARMAPDAFLCLSLSIDLHDTDPSAVDVPTDLISVDSDTLVPPWLMQELEVGLAGPTRHHRIRSIYGHDAFLKEVDAIGGLLSRILKREDTPS